MSPYARALLASAMALGLARCAPLGLDLFSDERSVSTDTHRVDLAYDEGERSCGFVQLDVDAADLDERYEYGVSGEDAAGLMHVSDELYDAEYATVALCPDPWLTPGTYTGQVKLHVVWSDRQELDGSPIAVDYQVVVRPVIRVQPTSVMLSGQAGLPGPQFSIDVDLPDGITDYDVTMTTLVRVIEKTPTRLTLQVNPQPRGAQSGYVTLTHGRMSAAVSIWYSAEPRPLVLTPAWLELTAPSGSTGRATATVQLPDDADAYSLGDFDPPGWLSVVERTVDHFTVEAAPAPSGTYHASIPVLAGASRYDLGISYTVTPSADQHGVLVAPPALAFSAVEGDAAPAQPLAVTPPSWGGEPWLRVGERAQAWLSATPTAGGWEVRADAGVLPQGTYVGGLYVGAGQWAATAEVPVTFTVRPTLVRPADRSVRLTGATVAADLAGSSAISSAGGPPRAWTASSDTAWLAIDTPSGTTGETLGYHVVPAAAAGLANPGAFLATVTVAAGTPITPVQFVVRLEKALPEVVAVVPAQPAGRPGHVLVRGGGFSAQPDLAALLEAPGLAGVQVSPGSDLELHLEVPATAAGDYAVRFTNRLGLPTREGVLHVFDPADPPAGGIEGPGARRGLAWDPVRRALYTADLGAGQVLRLAYDGQGWSRTAWDVGTVAALGLAPDLSAAVALTGSDELWVLDLTTGETARYPVLAGLGRMMAGEDLAVTNDGRVWLVAHGIDPLQLAWFDLRDRSIGWRSDVRFEGTPGYVASRDGEVLLLTGLPNWNSRAILHLLHASEGMVYSIDDPSLPRFTAASANEDGNRIALDNALVLDRYGIVVGSLQPPAGWFTTRGGAISADGTRFYSVEYEGVAAPPLGAPQVRVYDTSRYQGTAFPILGSFDLPARPSCPDPDACSVDTRLAVTPDGRTLFVDGRLGIQAIPIPAAYRSAASP